MFEIEEKNTFYEMSSNTAKNTTVSNNSEVVVQSDEIIEMEDALDLKSYQVVRREFFAHIYEPAISFKDYKISVNAACLRKFPETEFVQVIINAEDKIMALRPRKEEEKETFPWFYYSNGKKKPKSITCKIFFAKIVSLMNWNPDNRYKILGHVVHANGEYLLAFDLTATEVYQRTIDENNKPNRSRFPLYPEDWQNMFGIPFYEHKESMHINIFDGYAIYSVKDNSANAKPAPVSSSITESEIANNETENGDESNE